MVSKRQVSVLLLCGGLTLYFGYHTIKGRHGLETKSRLIERSTMLEREIGALETVRSALERELALLEGPGIDLDYVDELARRHLGFAARTDRILIERSGVRR
ncbi:septum formation initiator family protein [Hyphomicrobium sp. CS1BSMeth3]|uniref:FtsB family cell division protein n=1 Tax=Hyphomicrobium sp. CS1BSMeth3 TaxID=1892844 RepID=UPI00157697C8|nr:septum formation initiator family protein [Hyphomicrobium sp. CS1BSMeth3]